MIIIIFFGTIYFLEVPSVNFLAVHFYKDSVNLCKKRKS